MILNPNVEKIESNHEDANVEDYNYDYIIENDGTLGQLDVMAKFFVREIVCWNEVRDHEKPLVLKCSNMEVKS